MIINAPQPNLKGCLPDEARAHRPLEHRWAAVGKRRVYNQRWRSFPGPCLEAEHSLLAVDADRIARVDHGDRVELFSKREVLLGELPGQSKSNP